MRIKLALITLIALVLAGCATTPSTITHKKPTDEQREKARASRPQPPPVTPNGAIFQTASYRPIFEDHRARLVGDHLTIVITERTNATTSGTDRGARANQISAGVPNVLGREFPRLTASANSSRQFEESGARTANNIFSGTITVTVIDHTPTGNLIVSGDKQIAMDTGSEYIRFSGVVDPKDIMIGNQVPSTRVAEARVEYRTNTRVDKAEVMSRLARFFLSVFPF